LYMDVNYEKAASQEEAAYRMVCPV